MSVMVFVCPLVKKNDVRRSGPPGPPSYRSTVSGRSRSPHQPPSIPKDAAFMFPPTPACTKYVMPPHVRVWTPSCGATKMSSGDVLLLAENILRKLGSSEYAPDEITFSTAARASADRSLPVYTFAFKYRWARTMFAAP